MTSEASATMNLERPWEKPWPSDGLEALHKCPICNASERQVLHSDLVDSSFRCAPGSWTLWQCAKCRSAYLDPRPTPETIGLAYENYYTHGAGSSKVDYQSLNLLRKIRRRLVNGYSRRRYGSADEPAYELGFYLAHLVPFIRKVTDRQYRHIPFPAGNANKLLDIGCGNGDFLMLASSCGWEVCGLDPDANAVLSATNRGLDVHQAGEEHFKGESDLFDVITLSHVIEHVHSPRDTIENCFNLLKPGGMIWIETPNIDSFGYELFGKYWRGLETPRHITILNRQSLHNIISKSGFEKIRDIAIPSPTFLTYRASLAILMGESLQSPISNPRSIAFKAYLANVKENIFPSRREFLTVAARKPIY